MKNDRKKVLIGIFLILSIASVLRFWKLNEIPVSLFGDELDVGYHALSILKTGKDYSGNFLPLHFQSFAEWRTPLFIYSTIPTVFLWGVSPMGVRFPAALFGILGVLGTYFLTREIFKNYKNDSHLIALISAFVLAISPWHIQYSRAAFEVTMLLAFLIWGTYFFLKSFDVPKMLPLSAILFVTSPLIYSTAKLFVPFLFVFLAIAYWNKLLKLPRKIIYIAISALLIFGLPTAWSTLFGGGTQRIGYISVFTDPTTEFEIGTQRVLDAYSRGDLVVGLNPSFSDRLFHNKVVFWFDKISANYLKAFSTEFLFIKGDPNLRHSINGVGQLYIADFAIVLIGLFFFVRSKIDKKSKLLMIFWILTGPIPSSITRDGGNHATRLFVLLIPYTIFISSGIYFLWSKKRKLMWNMRGAIYLLMLFGNFIYYQHNFWVHNPYDSERWWHYGYGEAFEYIKENESNYERIFISMAGEPAWVFFAGWSEYSPDKWQQSFPFKLADVDGFGQVSYVDKYYFGSPTAEGGVYSLPSILDEKDLYLAVAKEFGTNYYMSPDLVPQGLELKHTVLYLSGEPAFYIFSKS